MKKRKQIKSHASHIITHLYATAGIQVDTSTRVFLRKSLWNTLWEDFMSQIDAIDIFNRQNK